jgi:hypothetical protein
MNIARMNSTHVSFKEANARIAVIKEFSSSCGNASPSFRPDERSPGNVVEDMTVSSDLLSCLGHE